MSWAKVDDGLHDHPKVDALIEADELRGAAALGLWVAALSYSADQLTDGVIGHRVVRRVLPAHGCELAGLLVEHGLWDVVEGGWRVRGYLDCNPGRQEVLTRRRADAERKAAARARRESARSPAGRPSGVPPDVRPESRAPSGHPDPTRPDPSQEADASLVDDAVASPTREPARPDVDRLCRLLAELILCNDPKAKVSPDSRRWRDACRLLLDADGRSAEQVEAVARWAQADPFWRSNVLSMPKLREKFGQLVLRMQDQGRASVSSPGGSYMTSLKEMRADALAEERAAAQEIAS